MTLGIISFFSGLALAVTYSLTLPIIQQNRAEALKEAVFKVLPGTQRFETLQLVDGKLVLLDPHNQTNQDDAASNPSIMLGFNENDEVVGFALPGKQSGFQDIISALFGFDPDKKTVVGLEVLESRETPGLGDKIMKDTNFTSQFRALSVEPEVVAVKPGTKRAANQVETITGATISAKAVVDLIQGTMEFWLPYINEYLQKEATTD